MSERLLPILLVLLLAACAGPTGDRRTTRADLDILAEDDRFAVVRIRTGQGYPQLAEALLGSRTDAWQIEEINEAGGVAGDVVGVPLQPVNVSGFYVDGYRTVPILCYHQFTPGSTTRQQLEVSATAFRQQLTYLRDNDYQVLALADFAEILEGRRPVPPRAVVLTIDDGYRSVYDVAWPILQEFGYPATLFVYTDFIGGSKALNWSQVREMAATGLLDIQSHGKSHTSLSRLPDDDSAAAYRARLQEEIQASGKVFDKRLGDRPVFLSYPYGNSSSLAVELLTDADYQLAATVTRGDNTVYADRFLLHRTMIYDHHSLEDFRKLLRNYRRKGLK
jgi:peptidoglycan/xylan/chitin deacetylase (PgdA/CDA1 family)